MKRGLLLAAGLLMASLRPLAAADPVPTPGLAPADAYTASAGDSLAPLPAGIELIYFHATLRCETCLALEAAIDGCLRGEFAGELAEGRLSWRSLNYEFGAGGALHAEFGLGGSELVIRERAASAAQPIRSVWNAPSAAAVCDSLRPLVTDYLRAHMDAEAKRAR